MKTKEQTKGILLAFTSMICYATSPTILKLAYRTGIVSHTLLFNRFLLSLALALIPWYFREKSSEKELYKNQIVVLIAISIFSGLSNLLYNEAYRSLPSVVSTVITLSYAVMVLVLEMLSGYKRIQKEQVIAIIFASVGLYLIAVPYLTNNISAVPLLFGIMASFVYAVQLLLINSNVMKNVSLELIFIATNIPIILIAGVSAVVKGEPLLINSLDQGFYIVLLAVLNVLIARMAFFKAIRLIGAARASTIDMLEPFISAIGGYLFFREILSVHTTIGMMLIMTVIFIINSKSKEESKC